jgi:hypothetical protein
VFPSGLSPVLALVAMKSFLGRLHCCIDVLRCGSRNVSNTFFRGGIDNGNALALDRLHPLAVNEEPALGHNLSVQAHGGDEVQSGRPGGNDERPALDARRLGRGGRDAGVAREDDVTMMGGTKCGQLQQHHHEGGDERMGSGARMRRE